jgi:hypothetical protein
LGYKWVTKNCGFAVNQALFDALAAVAFNKQPVKKPSGARHAFGSNSSDLSNSLSRSRVGLRGPRALGHVFGKRFLAERYEYVVSRLNLKLNRAAALAEWCQLLSA